MYPTMLCLSRLLNMFFNLNKYLTEISPFVQEIEIFQDSLTDTNFFYWNPLRRLVYSVPICFKFIGRVNENELLTTMSNQNTKVSL